MYYPSLPVSASPSDVHFSQWFTRVHERLRQWHRKTHESVHLREKIEFHEVHYQLQMLRLNRPSPRCPDPTPEMQKEALKSSIAIIREYSIIERLGKLFYLFHAAICLVEAGICLLALVLVGMEEAVRGHTYLATEDVAILQKYMQTFTSLLWKISRRWPSIAQHASILEAMSVSIVKYLQQWLNGESMPSSSLYSLHQQLDELSQFSPFPLKPQATQDAMPRIIESSVSDGTNLSGDLYQTFDPPQFPLQGTGAASVDRAWATNNDAYSALINPPSFDGADMLAWEFPGMSSEEIFAALHLDGEAL